MAERRKSQNLDGPETQQRGSSGGDLNPLNLHPSPSPSPLTLTTQPSPSPSPFTLTLTLPLAPSPHQALCARGGASPRPASPPCAS